MPKVTPKKKSAKSAEETVAPELVENTKVEEKFQTANSLPGYNAGFPTYTVKVDTKKFENRSITQVHALVEGADGAAKRITIERE